MVQCLMAQSGGQLVLTSKSGVDTTAELWLPVSGEPLTLAAYVTETVFDPAPTAMTVLVVDDDALVLMNTVLLLKDLGMETVQASSGEETMTILDSGEFPAAVITDHAMPQMTGAQLCRRIREQYPASSPIRLRRASRRAQASERRCPIVEAVGSGPLVAGSLGSS